MAKIKKIVRVVLLILLASIVVWACYTAASFYRHYQNTVLRSAVKAPVRLGLQEILKDIENNRYDAAKKKINILNQCWNDFYLHEGIDNSLSDILYKFKAAEE